MLRTFVPMSIEDASDELREVPQLATVTELPSIEHIHPLMAMEAGVVVCAHDDANGCSYQTLLPAEYMQGERGGEESREGFEERTREHLERLARAVFN